MAGFEVHSEVGKLHTVRECNPGLAALANPLDIQHFATLTRNRNDHE